MTRCPSELALEAYLLGPEKSPLAQHVHGCARCSERVARMEREGEHFRRFVLPATLDAVVAKNAPRPRRRWFWALLAPAAVAATLLVTLRPAQPPDDYVGFKGGFGLAAYLAAPGGARAVADGQAIEPAAALRFRVRPAGQCSLWLISVDEAGQISRIYPPKGEGGATVSQADALPGGALLDGRPGLERFYAVCTPEPLSYGDLVRSVRSAVLGPAHVRAGPTLTGLPKGARQASLLIEKRP